MASNKIILYQIFTRLYGNTNQTCKPNGTIEENGCGKMNDFTPAVLKHISQLGVSHIWYTGVIRHATMTDYTKYGIPRQHPAVVKGRAGSPYAITDYYDIDPDLAVNVDKRMAEFEQLVERTHKAGMKVIIDFVPNHVARQYKSIGKPHTDPAEIKQNLIAQLTSSVRWTQCVQSMIADGATDFTECGPGKVLQGTIAKISKEVTAHGIE